MSLTVTDLFCGAGGSGLGAHAAGFDLVIAANHWAKAIETHAANFPDTEHDCADISQVDPRRYPATDVLWASPECTKWSIANNKAKALSAEMGGDPSLFDEVPDELVSSDEDEATRSRLLMLEQPDYIGAERL